jgi:hypothetical protein
MHGELIIETISADSNDPQRLLTTLQPANGERPCHSSNQRCPEQVLTNKRRDAEILFGGTDPCKPYSVAAFPS